jgi:hypothetical protein
LFVSYNIQETGHNFWVSFVIESNLKFSIQKKNKVIIHLPYDVVYTNHTLWFLFVINNCCLCHQPWVATITGQKTISRCFCLSFTYHCKGKKKKNRNDIEKLCVCLFIFVFWIIRRCFTECVGLLWVTQDANCANPVFDLHLARRMFFIWKKELQKDDFLLRINFCKDKVIFCKKTNFCKPYFRPTFCRTVFFLICTIFCKNDFLIKDDFLQKQKYNQIFVKRR